MIHLLLLLSPPAHAYETHSYIGTTGNHRTMHFCAVEFPSGWVDEITKGFNAWNAGVGTRMPGAQWNWTRGSDKTGCSLGNWFDSEVWDENQDYFDDHAWDGSARTQVNAFGAAKVVFNESLAWTLDTPNDVPNVKSVRDTAMHEFGHAIGFDHDFSYNAMSVMNYIDVDMARGRARIREDDYVGLAAHKPEQWTMSAGINLMLSRWTMYGDEETQEAWRPNSGQDFACAEPSAFNTTLGFVRPGFLHAVIHGTQTASNVLIEWRASPDKACFTSPTSYIIGSRTPSLGVNDEYGITTPSGGLDFSGVPPGNYYICAKIDPYDVFVETAEDDNSIVSHETIEVKPDGWGCPP